MQTLLLVIEILVAIALVVVVLMQRSEGGALGIGGGGGGGLGGLFSARGASDTLTRTTAILGIMFFVICLALNLLVKHSYVQRSILDSQAAPTRTTEPVRKPATPAPTQQSPSIPTPH